jgi:hypothetical protein
MKPNLSVRKGAILDCTEASLNARRAVHYAEGEHYTMARELILVSIRLLNRAREALSQLENTSAP